MTSTGFSTTPNASIGIGGVVAVGLLDDEAIEIVVDTVFASASVVATAAAFKEEMVISAWVAEAETVPPLAAFLLFISSSSFSLVSIIFSLNSKRMDPDLDCGEVPGEGAPSGDPLKASGQGVASREPRFVQRFCNSPIRPRLLTGDDS